jgi:hypothetical protein
MGKENRMTVDEARELPGDTYVTDGKHYYRYIPDADDSRRLLPNRTLIFYRCNRAGRLHPKRFIVRVFLGERLDTRCDASANLDRLATLRRIEANERGWLPMLKGKDDGHQDQDRL